MAQRLGTLYLCIDAIEQAISSQARRYPVRAVTGYVVSYRIPADNLKIGGRVVTDFVDPLRITRDAWFSVDLNRLEFGSDVRHAIRQTKRPAQKQVE